MSAVAVVDAEAVLREVIDSQRGRAADVRRQRRVGGRRLSETRKRDQRHECYTLASAAFYVKSAGSHRLLTADGAPSSSSVARSCVEVLLVVSFAVPPSPHPTSPSSFPVSLRAPVIRCGFLSLCAVAFARADTPVFHLRP